ncbi:hypothetical protein EVAR_11439_1 [Eumeta japonica]|uniref:Secreted protein n=1 Tax=Eumeta variegata TaxID=151549 RepID=A0A4C1TKW1_EUMVA|nr:hypothetical protein EVAR_11439_1 [Eumeta japonica]
MVKNHILSVAQFRPFLLYFLLQSHQLLAVEIRIDGFDRRLRNFKKGTIGVWVRRSAFTPAEERVGRSTPPRIVAQ